MLAGFDAKPLKRESRRLIERAQNRVGFLEMWPLATAPAGYLVCNGAAVSRQAYGPLFAVIGTTFGAGDGSTTFNLPNYVDRMPIGSGNLYSVGSTGGSKDAINVAHSHTTSETPHGHGTNETPHAHAQGDFTGVNNIAAGGLGANVRLVGDPTQGNTGTATTGITIQTNTTGVAVNSSGASGTNANLPPYLGVNFIIKT